jgi:hypothetical protein
MPETQDSDDALIARLKKAEGLGPHYTHDPFFDLPLANEVKAKPEPPTPGQDACMATGRRTREVPGLMAYPVREEIRCELPAGHAGVHRACFTQTRLTHRWHAFEWSSPTPSG